MNKKVMIGAIAAILVLAGIYFGYQKVDDNKISGGSLEITHELGIAKISPNPQKVVVFDYGTLDTLDELGIPVAGVAKASLPNYLSKYENEKYTDIGTLFEPNFEVLAKLAPDLILISGRQQTQYDALTAIAPTIYFTIDSKDYMGSFEKNVTQIGEIFGKEKEVTEKLKKITSSIDNVKAEVEKNVKNGLILMTNEGKLSAYGGISRFGIIHNTFGVTAVDENIEASTHGQSVGFEYIVEKNPNYIFVIDRNAAVGTSVDGSQAFENDLMNATTAYKEGNIVFLDPEVWYLSTGGLQSTEKMIAEITSGIA